MQSVWFNRFTTEINVRYRERGEYLMGGGARTDGNSPTGESYMHLVGYLEGLRDAMSIARGVDEQILGHKNAEDATKDG